MCETNAGSDGDTPRSTGSANASTSQSGTPTGATPTSAPVSVVVNPASGAGEANAGSSGDAPRQPEPTANAQTSQPGTATSTTSATGEVVINQSNSSMLTDEQAVAIANQTDAVNATSTSNTAPTVTRHADGTVVVDTASGTDDSGTGASDATRQPEPATNAQTSQTGTATSATNATGEVVINQSNSSMLTDEKAVAIANQTDAVSATDTNNTAPKITRHADGTVVVDQSNEDGAKSPTEKDSGKSSPDK